ncbi:MAG: hypothetical protein ABI797_06675, partial [Chloroflexota bacterium]
RPHLYGWQAPFAQPPLDGASADTQPARGFPWADGVFHAANVAFVVMSVNYRLARTVTQGV